MLNWNFIACCLSNLLFYTSVYVLVPVLPLYLVDEFQADKPLAGVILSLFVFSSMFIRPFSGFFVDMFQRKPLYLFCYFIFTALFAGYLLAGTLFVLAIVRAIHGLIFSVGTTSATALAVDLLPIEKQGRGIGLFGVTTSAGMLFGPITGLTVLDFYSFQSVFAVALAIAITALMIGISIKPPERQPTDHADACQDDSPGEMPGGDKADCRTITGFMRSLKRIILIQALPIALCAILVMFFYGAIVHYFTLFIRERDIHVEAGIFFVLLSLGLMAGRLAGGWFVDKGALFMPVLIGKMLILAAVSALWQDVFLLAGILCGFGYGMIFPSYQTIFIRLANESQRGIAVSTYRTATDFGTGLAVILGGLIAEWSSFFALFLIGAFLILLSLVLFHTFAGPHYTRQHDAQYPTKPDSIVLHNPS